ncbi:MAG: HAMP domain-containing histidine kinase [Eubacterium sp.]|nr:HAMP domain-containing histidine kinase [Eubacterium sp.]
MISFSFNTAFEREKASAYNSYQSMLGTLQVINEVNQYMTFDGIGEVLKQVSDKNAGSWTALRLYVDEKTLYSEGDFDFSVNDITVSADNCVTKYFTNENGNCYLLITGNLEAGEDVLFLDMVCDITAVAESQNILLKIYMGVFLLLVLLCAALSGSISKLLTKPLSELSRASREISSGNLSRRAEVKTNDEVGFVAYDFNAMVTQLENNINHQEQFIASFAHETKTPMTSIIGYADLIRSGILDADEIKEAADYIASEGKRLENLSQKLLELIVAGKEKRNIKPVSVSDLINDFAEIYRPVYEKQNIELFCDCEAGVCLLDADLIKSLIINLCDNARKAFDGRKGIIKIKSIMIENGCAIQICDNGPGIPEKDIHHLTEAFYRVDKSRSRKMGGSGLGLSLCKEIAAVHDGSIKIESELDKGTAVTVVLRGGAAE